MLFQRPMPYQSLIPTFKIIFVIAFMSVSSLTLTGCDWLNSMTTIDSGVTAISDETSAGEPCSGGAEPADTPVYVSIVIHFEETFPQNAPSYARARCDLLDLADLCRKYDLRFNLQPDWAFVTAMQKYETEEMRLQTNGKNLLRYLAEDREMEIDPHSHEHKYNYADVAYLLNTCGVNPSTIAGGLIAGPEKVCQLERFLEPFKGRNYDYSWRAEYIWGGGTPNHVDEPVASGIWWPQDCANFYVNKDGASIPSIGSYTREIEDIYSLVEKISIGDAPAGHCYTACIMFNQGFLRADLEELTAEISKLKGMEAKGQIRFVSLQELIDVWEEDFDSQGFVYLEEPREREARP